MVKKLIKKIARLVFSEEIRQLQVVIAKNQKVIIANENWSKILQTKVEKAEQAQRTFEQLLSNFDCSVDVHTNRYHSSWAVISLQGQKSDYLKFIDLGSKDCSQIVNYLRQFEKANPTIKIDANPDIAYFMKQTFKIEKYK